MLQIFVSILMFVSHIQNVHSSDQFCSNDGKYASIFKIGNHIYIVSNSSTIWKYDCIANKISDSSYHMENIFEFDKNGAFVELNTGFSFDFEQNCSSTEEYCLSIGKARGKAIVIGDKLNHSAPFTPQFYRVFNDDGGDRLKLDPSPDLSHWKISVNYSSASSSMGSPFWVRGHASNYAAVGFDPTRNRLYAFVRPMNFYNNYMDYESGMWAEEWTSMTPKTNFTPVSIIGLFGVGRRVFVAREHDIGVMHVTIPGHRNETPIFYFSDLKWSFAEFFNCYGNSTLTDPNEGLTTAASKPSSSSMLFKQYSLFAAIVFKLLSIFY